MRPASPVVSQVVKPTLPPGLQTRSSSCAAWRWCGANMWPNVESTRSKLASANGSASASPTTHSTSTSASAARRRAASNHASVMSAPTTSAPRCAAGMATLLPEPVPTSSTRMPGSIPTRSRRRGPTEAMWFATASQSPADHTARFRSWSSLMERRYRTAGAA